MFTVMKNDGAISTASRDREGNLVAPRKGNLGRLEFFLERDEDGDITLNFRDYGNYGRERWFGQLPLDINDLSELQVAIGQFIDGTIDTTHMPAPELVTAPEAVEAEETEEGVEETLEVSPETIASSDELLSEVASA